MSLLFCIVNQDITISIPHNCQNSCDNYTISKCVNNVNFYDKSVVIYNDKWRNLTEENYVRV